MLYLCILIYFVFFAGIAMTIGEGMWSNAVSLLAVLVCGPLAIVLGYPLGIFALDKLEKGDEFMWHFVFGGVWLVFFFSIMAFRVIADRMASRVRMKFVPPLELVGGPLVGLAVAVMFTSFVTFTLYTIPIRAGEWTYADASSWQQSTMKSGSGPFFTVLKNTVGEAIANASVGQ